MFHLGSNMLLVTLAWYLTLVGVVETSELSPTPVASWPMDRSSWSQFQNGGGDPSAVGQYNASDMFVQGVLGDALHVKGRQLDVAENTSCCVANPGLCQSELSVVFWVKLEAHGPNSSRLFILWSTDENTMYSGLFFHVTGEELLMSFTLPNSETYNVSTSLFAMNEWTNIGVTWNATSSVLQLFVNGSRRSTSQKNVGPLGETASPSAQSSSYSLIVGQYLGPTFCLDELSIFNETLTEDDIANIYRQVQTPTKDKKVLDYKTILLAATVAPAAITMMSFFVVCCFCKKHKTKKSLRNYARQTSLHQEIYDVHADTVDDHSDDDTDAEMEKLNSRLLITDA